MTMPTTWYPMEDSAGSGSGTRPLGTDTRRPGIDEEVAEQLLRLVAFHPLILADDQRKLSQTPRPETRSPLASDHVR